MLTKPVWWTLSRKISIFALWAKLLENDYLVDSRAGVESLRLELAFMACFLSAVVISYFPLSHSLSLSLSTVAVDKERSEDGLFLAPLNMDAHLHAV